MPAPTLTAVAGGGAVTFGGSAGPGQVAGLLVDGVAYAYRLRDGDTPGAVAAELAALVRADRPAELPTFDMGPPLEVILERCLEETGLPAPQAPTWA